jgi:hypothetical protein
MSEMRRQDAAVFALRASGYVKTALRQVAEPRMNADEQDHFLEEFGNSLY